MQTGCYVVSPNFAYAQAEGFVFEGLSAASSPDGQLLALTSASEPFATVAISVVESRQAKSMYPRYIIDDDQP